MMIAVVFTLTKIVKKWQFFFDNFQFESILYKSGYENPTHDAEHLTFSI